MRSRSTWLAVLLAVLLIGGLGACTDKGVEATVALQIDGVKHDYTTRSAETDQQVIDGPRSIYLLRDDGQDGPTLSIRTFSGNPVAQLSLRGAGAPDRYECFVPGTLSDGRATLGWKTAEGKDRNRQETGDEGCLATVTGSGDALELTVDAVMQPIIDKGAKVTGPAPEKVQVRARATVRLR